MEPYAFDGDYAVATRIFIHVKVGDVVVFRSPSDGMILIKRVKKRDDADNSPRFFMEGDNRMRSRDSNVFGYVERDRILGKVLFIARKNRKE